MHQYYCIYCFHCLSRHHWGRLGIQEEVLLTRLWMYGMWGESCSFSSALVLLVCCAFRCSLSTVRSQNPRDLRIMSSCLCFSEPIPIWLALSSSSSSSFSCRRMDSVLASWSWWWAALRNYFWSRSLMTWASRERDSCTFSRSMAYLLSSQLAWMLAELKYEPTSAPHWQLTLTYRILTTGHSVPTRVSLPTSSLPNCISRSTRASWGSWAQSATEERGSSHRLQLEQCSRIPSSRSTLTRTASQFCILITITVRPLRSSPGEARRKQPHSRETVEESDAASSTAQPYDSQVEERVGAKESSGRLQVGHAHRNKEEDAERQVKTMLTRGSSTRPPQQALYCGHQRRNAYRNEQNVMRLKVAEQPNLPVFGLNVGVHVTHAFPPFTPQLITPPAMKSQTTAESRQASHSLSKASHPLPPGALHCLLQQFQPNNGGQKESVAANGHADRKE